MHMYSHYFTLTITMKGHIEYIPIIRAYIVKQEKTANDETTAIPMDTSTGKSTAQI